MERPRFTAASQPRAHYIYHEAGGKYGFGYFTTEFANGSIGRYDATSSDDFEYNNFCLEIIMEHHQLGTLLTLMKAYQKELQKLRMIIYKN